jgi:hypothetical protein
MKLSTMIACSLVLAMPTMALAAGYGCDNVNFSAEVLAKMPNAQKLCHDVAEKNGGIYAHYVAEVESAKADAVTVKFLDKDNKAVSRVTFQPAADQTVSIQKKPTKFSSLSKGQKLDFWIQHNKWGLYASPDGKPMTIVSVEPL